MSEVVNQVRSFVIERFLSGQDAASLKNDTSLERAHIVDSAGMMELIYFIEETYGFTVDNEDALPENFDTIDNIAAYIERKRGAR